MKKSHKAWIDNGGLDRLNAGKLKSDKLNSARSLEILARTLNGESRHSIYQSFKRKDAE